MTNRGTLSLPELAARYKISDIFGASVACYSSREGGPKDLRNVTNRISCYELHLILQGSAEVTIDDKKKSLKRGDLLILTPFQPAECSFSADSITEGLLIESSFYASQSLIDNYSEVRMSNIPQNNNFVYHLDDEKMAELSGIFQQIRKSIKLSHIYKIEMIRSLVHVCLLFISELPYEENILGNDFRHKQNIFRIFLQLAYNNFKKERRIQFYADKLNMTSTYLSRIIREISGNTIADHLLLLTYNEACNLIKSTDLTMGEISDQLNFHDQSAFTNFFKQHAGCSPNTYRQQNNKGH